MIFWQPPPPPEYGVTTFFATYFYHGNAGAFLNLVWPLSAGLVIRAFTSQSQPGMRALWTIVFIVTIAGVLANTSRMAQVVALVLLIVIGLRFGPGLLRRLPGAQKSVAIAGALAFILALIALAQATHLEQPLSRWQSVSEPNSCRCALASFTRGARSAAWRRIFRVRAGNVSRCVPRLQHRIRPRRSGKLEVFTRRLPADSPGMGMAGKQPLGIALLRRYSSRNS